MNGGHTALVVDDDALIRWALRRHLGRSGYRVIEADTGATALALASEPLDCVLLDRCLPDGDGIELLGELRATQPDVPVIVMTAYGSVQAALDAKERGAFAFVEKPFDVPAVIALVHRCIAERRRSTPPPPGDGFAALVGESPVMQEVRALLRQYALSPSSTVLITGESGTGKDLAARAIHAASGRSAGAFVNITCSALPETLLESELFGHEKGAFTSAGERKKGLFELGDGGTVFLDEVGELPLGLQAKLLRVLEERAFRRVGGNEEIRPNVRVIAATNRSLEDAVAAGTFRKDLFYRLDVLRARMPPLRDRHGDVALLARHFVERLARRLEIPPVQLSAGAIRALEAYPWPGNVRELRNALERAVVLAEGDALRAKDFAHLMLAGPVARSARLVELPPEGTHLFALERDLVAQALERAAGNQTQAATLLGLTRDQMRTRVARYELHDYGRRH